MITMARGMINESYRVGCGRVLHAAVTRQYWFADFPWHDAHENDAIVVARTTSHANDAIVVVESALPVDDAVVGLLLTAESLAESPAEGRDEKIAVEFVDALTGRSHIYTMRTTDCFAAAFRSCEVMVEPRSLHQFYYDGNQLHRRYCPLDLPDFAEAPRIDYKRSSEGGGGKEYMREYRAKKKLEEESKRNGPPTTIAGVEKLYDLVDIS